MRSLPRGKGTTMPEAALDALLHETRRFEPPPELAAQANAKPGLYGEAATDRIAFWEKQAEWLRWEQKWDTALEWELPYAKWFVGGKLNAAVNCLDRHVEAGFGDKVAYHWVGDGERETRDVTYAQLQELVCQAANALTELGIRAGDRFAIYWPRIPETFPPMPAARASAHRTPSSSAGS